MKQLIVTAHLERGLSAANRWSPSLDGILAYQLLRKEKGDSVFRAEVSKGVQSTVQNLPLLKHTEFDTDWWWACSSPNIDTICEVNRGFYKKFNTRKQQYINQKARYLNLTNGQFKNYSMLFKHIICKSIAWHCIGDKEAIEELLAKTNQVGAHRGKGLGFVTKWDVQECAFDSDLAIYFRPVPTAHAKREYTVVRQQWGYRPSVRLRENVSLCALPI